MDTLRTVLKDIGLEELVNCILVQKGIRNAFLIQPADYNELDFSSPKTAKLLIGISKHFPELKQSIVGLDILISKQSYNSSDITSNAIMGTIIGYPCADEYDSILAHPDEPSTTIQITVSLVPGGDEEKLQLLAYRCSDDSKFKQAQVFAARAKQVLESDPRISPILIDVIAEKSINIPTKIIIQKLIMGTALNEMEEYELRNILWNNFSDELSRQVADYEYDYANPVHKGVLLTLLTYCEDTPLAAFYPLQLHKEGHEVKKLTQKWALELVRILEATKKPRAGGKRKNKTRKV